MTRAPDPSRPLSADARRVLDAVAAQAQRTTEVLPGLCATEETHQTKHGRFGFAAEPETREYRLDEPGIEAGPEGFFPWLTGCEYDRREVPTSDANELHVRVTGRVPSEDTPGADLILTRQPPALVEARLHVPSAAHVMATGLQHTEAGRPPQGPSPEVSPLAARLAGWLVNEASLFIRVGYVRGVPLPVETRIRVRSRGVGRFRVDQEVIVRMSYAPCAEPSAPDA